MQVGEKTNPYRIGDRVYWYDKHGARYSDDIDIIKGDFVGLTSGKTMHFRFLKGKIKPRRKLREVWVREQDIPAPLRSGHAIISAAELVGDKYIQFREVKRK